MANACVDDLKKLQDLLANQYKDQMASEVSSENYTAAQATAKHLQALQAFDCTCYVEIGTSMALADFAKQVRAKVIGLKELAPSGAVDADALFTNILQASGSASADHAHKKRKTE